MQDGDKSTSGSGSDGKQSTSPADDRRSAKIVDHPHWKLIGAVVALLAGIITILVNSPKLFGSSDDTAQPPASLSATTSTDVPSALSAMPTSASSSTTEESNQDAPRSSAADPASQSAGRSSVQASAAPVVAGQCLRTDGSPTLCTAVHRYEVVSASKSDCSSDKVIRYLGGSPDIDVVLLQIGVSSDQAVSSACVISTVDSVERSEPLKGVLGTNRADSVRRCRDDRSAPTDLNCNVAHTGEYVGTAAGAAPDQTQCESAASRYMGISFAEVSDRLDVLAFPTSDPDSDTPKCVVTVRGNEVLIASLRKVGVNALPLKAAD